MSLTAGARLGPYVIEAPIGRGGMGEVYRALDTRLQRAVAIKVLATGLASDPQSRQRFEREARAVAALEHAHICPVYDVGEHEGSSFLVMQYLQGETLATRLSRGLPSLDEAVRYATQLAAALDAAHRAGVVHRDLKPGNVMVTKSGVKLLDFGLARVSAPGPRALASPIGTQSTRSMALTEQGMLLGTLPYMAPEQVEGKPADGRTDIFALGALTYEMATGRRPFAGDSAASLIAAILGSDPPPMSVLRPGVPRSLDRTVRKCLAKDPDARWQSASDLADELKWIVDVPVESAGVPHATTGSPIRDARVWLLAFSLSALAATAAWVLRPTPSPAAVSSAHFTVELPMGAQLWSAPTSPTLAFSPDGRHLVYTVTMNGETQLFTRAVDQVESKAIAGTEGGVMPFFSPDGRWVGFDSKGMLRRVSMSGGPAMPIVSTPDATGATWSPDDRIAFAPFNRSGLSVVSASGGPPRQLTTLDPQKRQTSHRFPEFLPGGRAIIFTAGPPATGAWYDAEIAAQSLDTGERHVLVRGGAQAHYVSPGYLVYARAGTLFAVPFDAKELRVRGAAVAVLEGVREDQSSGGSQFTVSASGSLAYVPGGLRRTEVVWVDRRGQAERLISEQEPRLFRQPRLSPDGRQLAISVASGNDDVWVYGVAHEVLSRFTSGANHLYPGWTPDGKRITFFRSEHLQIVGQPADRSGPEEAILTGASGLTPHSWSPDGRLLTFTQSSPTTGSDIWVLGLEDGKQQPLIQTPFAELTPMISPDGRWLAYTADESGRLEVYVQPFPGDGTKTQVSRDGGTEPLWARSGHELFFRQGDIKLMAVTVTNGRSPGRPHLLFEVPRWEAQDFRTNYDVAADGQRFVMIRSIGPDAAAARIHVVLNWADELRRRVPR